MEKRDLSVLSLNELMEMLKAMTFTQNEKALEDNKGVEEERLKTEEEEHPVKAYEKSKMETKNDVALTDEKDNKEYPVELEEGENQSFIEQELKTSPSSSKEKLEVKTELQPVMLPNSSFRRKDAATEKRLEEEPSMLQAFSAKGKIGEVLGNNKKEEKKSEVFLDFEENAKHSQICPTSICCNRRIE